LLIPVTGFAPDQVTPLPIQPADKVYKTLGEMNIEIPTLGINFPIVGAAINKNGWDLTWLKNNVAYLEGSAYPTLAGNTVLTAHVRDSNNGLGPFSDIKGMQLGQKIYIHANGQVYIYQVQENRKVLPSNISVVFKHEEYDWITLVTCEDFNAKTGLYAHRRMVRAVLISIIPEK
jgi:LPXTG-site transpeptidase (sortase) family protein